MSTPSFLKYVPLDLDTGLLFDFYILISSDIQRVLVLCDFWDLEKFALAKNRIRHVSIANVRIN